MTDRFGRFFSINKLKMGEKSDSVNNNNNNKNNNNILRLDQKKKKNKNRTFAMLKSS